MSIDQNASLGEKQYHCECGSARKKGSGCENKCCMFSELEHGEDTRACSSCGYRWQRGLSGEHSCTYWLNARIERLEKILSAVAEDLMRHEYGKDGRHVEVMRKMACYSLDHAYRQLTDD